MCKKAEKYHVAVEMYPENEFGEFNAICPPICTFEYSSPKICLPTEDILLRKIKEAAVSAGTYYVTATIEDLHGEYIDSDDIILSVDPLEEMIKMEMWN